VDDTVTVVAVVAGVVVRREGVVDTATGLAIGSDAFPKPCLDDVFVAATIGTCWRITLPNTIKRMRKETKKKQQQKKKPWVGNSFCKLTKIKKRSTFRDPRSVRRYQLSMYL
jgi:hypothetical protein